MKRIKIRKPDKPLLFFDTFVWKNIITNNDYKSILELLQLNCSHDKPIIPITNFIEGELRSQKIFRKIKEIAKNTLVLIPVGRITFNQLLGIFVAFYEKLNEIESDWELLTERSGLVKYCIDGLKINIDNLSEELNKIRNYSLKFNRNRKRTIIYSNILTLYKNLWFLWLRFLKRRDFFNLSYKTFFNSNYFLKSQQ